MLDWFDKRLFIREVLMHPSLPRGRASWQYFPGFMTFLLLLFQFLTGILLYFSFSFTDFVANLFLYKLHYATGKLLVLFATIHLLRNFLVGSYHNLRELHWILLTTVVLFIWLNYFLGLVLNPQIDKETLSLLKWFVSVKNNTISNDQLKNVFAVHTAIIPIIIYTLYLMYFYLLKKTGLESRNED